MSNFEQDVQEWVELDNKLKAYNEQIRQLRQKEAC